MGGFMPRMQSEARRSGKRKNGGHLTKSREHTVLAFRVCRGFGESPAMKRLLLLLTPVLLAAAESGAPVQKFQQLDPSIPTPSAQRNASGAPGTGLLAEPGGL
jgi:hypothetical protein